MQTTKLQYTLLYLEDEEIVRKNYVNYLSRYFEIIYEASTAEEALKIYKANKIDIMIIDINLPQKDGITFLQEIREFDHNVKAIMLTAKSDIETLLDTTALKLSRYLVKPISRDELKAALDGAVDEIMNYTVHTNKVVRVSEICFWDSEREQLLFNNKDVDLTKKERDLLAYLFSDTHRVFRSEDIMYELWYDYDNQKISSLKTLVKTLRRKIPEGLIKNVFGIGYKIEI